VHRGFPKIKSGLLLASLTLLTACGGEGTANGGQMPPPTVGVYDVQAQPLTLTAELPGRTIAYQKAEVRPQVNGIIEKRLFTEGAYIEEGQQLYQIDDAKYKAAYQRAQATLKNAKQLADRYASLKETSAVSRQQYDDAVTAYELALAEAELAEIELEYTRVLAPISGRIGRSSVTEGALVSDGQTQALATIQQLDPIYVDINQPVNELLKLQEDRASGAINEISEDQAEAQLFFESGKAYGLKGVLRFSEVSVDESTGSVTLRAVFPNPDGKLLPGMFVNTRIVTGYRQDALLIPQQAVQRDLRGKPVVWRVNANDQVNQVSILTERTLGNQWLVSSGLEAGDRIVTEGLFMLQPGSPVTVTPATNVNPVTTFSAPPAETAATSTQDDKN